MTPSAHAVVELNESEMADLLEEQCQRYLHMSADEFFRRADSGTLPDHAAVEHLKMIAGIE